MTTLIDQFGATHAERVAQFTVPGWTPQTPYTVRAGKRDARGRAMSWLVERPGGGVQDSVATKREAHTHCDTRNAHARWAYEGGPGETVPRSAIRFRTAD